MKLLIPISATGILLLIGEVPGVHSNDVSSSKGSDVGEFRVHCCGVYPSRLALIGGICDVCVSCNSLVTHRFPSPSIFQENGLRGSPPHDAELLSVERYHMVLDLDSASAAAVGVDEEVFALEEVGGGYDGSAGGGGECENYEEDRDYEKEVNSWCFQAHQTCCSSVKKYDKWQSFCSYYGFEKPVEQAEGIAGYNPMISSSVDCSMCDDSKCDADGDTRRETRKPTRKPTKKPHTNRETSTMMPTMEPTMEAYSGECENYEEDRDYQKEVNSWCFQAHQLCCSSVKKYDKWQNFCFYYGFENPGEESEGIAGYNPSTFSTVDCTMCGKSKCDADETNLIAMISSR